MEKKYKISYGSFCKNEESKSTIYPLIKSGDLIEWFRVYESWNSQYRSKECRKNREELKMSFFVILRHIDLLMNTHQIQYDELIKKGISPNEIEYDKEEIIKSRVEYWEQKKKEMGLR